VGRGLVEMVERGLVEREWYENGDSLWWLWWFGLGQKVDRLSTLWWGFNNQQFKSFLSYKQRMQRNRNFWLRQERDYLLDSLDGHSTPEYYTMDYDADLLAHEAASWYPELEADSLSEAMEWLESTTMGWEEQRIYEEEKVFSADPVVISEQQKPMLASVRLPEKVVPAEKTRMGYKAHKKHRRNLHIWRVRDKGIGGRRGTAGTGMSKQPKFDLSYDVEVESERESETEEENGGSDSGSETEADPLE
jgi:hypothetical protein